LKTNRSSERGPAPFENDYQEEQHPEGALIKDQRVRVAIEPRTKGGGVVKRAVAEKIGQGLDENEPDHAKRCQPRK